MIAKLICWDSDKTKAILRMKRALNEYQIAGVITNQEFLKYIITNGLFINGYYDINFIDSLNLNEISSSENYSADLENAAALLAALNKFKKSNSGGSRDNKTVQSKWWNQNYE